MEKRKEKDITKPTGLILKWKLRKTRFRRGEREGVKTLACRERGRTGASTLTSKKWVRLQGKDIPLLDLRETNEASGLGG